MADSSSWPSPLLALQTAVGALDRHLVLEQRELARRREALAQLDAQIAKAVAATDGEDTADESSEGNSDSSDGDAVAVARSPSAPTIDLAREMEDDGDVETAAALCERVVAHRRKTYGADHPRTHAALRKLASLWHDAGRVAAARPLYRELHLRKSAELGAHHPRTLSALVDLAMALKDEGALEEAEGMLREALYGQLRARGRRHRETLGTVGNLADVLRAQGRYADATRIFGDALTIALDALGPAHMTTLVLGAKGARLRGERARSEGRAGDAAAAAEQLWQVVESMRHVLGDAHPQTRKYAGVLVEARGEG